VLDTPFRIVVKLDPSALSNPDLDIRYVLPDVLTDRSRGVIRDDGYDYASDKIALLIFLKTDHLNKALSCIIDVVENVQLLGNILRTAAVIAVQREAGFEVIYPADFQGPFVI